MLTRLFSSLRSRVVLLSFGCVVAGDGVFQGWGHFMEPVGWLPAFHTFLIAHSCGR